MTKFILVHSIVVVFAIISYFNIKIQINFVYLNNRKTALLCDNDTNKHFAQLFYFSTGGH